jgi:uncharacterized phiE125 gp8 family phage protein
MDEGIHWNLSLVTAPAAEPVTAAETKLALRIDASEEDVHTITSIKAARIYIEGAFALRLIQSTWDLKLDRFPCEEIVFPYSPLSSVTSISYIDTSGTTQTWSSAEYIVDSSSKPGRITPAYGYTFPSTQSRINAVTIRHVMGYGTGPSSIPENIKLAMWLLIGHWHENRESVIVGSISKEMEYGVAALMGLDNLNVL